LADSPPTKADSQRPETKDAVLEEKGARLFSGQGMVSALATNAGREITGL